MTVQAMAQVDLSAARKSPAQAEDIDALSNSQTDLDSYAKVGQDEEKVHQAENSEEVCCNDKEAAAGCNALKEWAPLHHLMLQIPAKYQNLLSQGELRLTSVAAVEDFILLGSNTGSLYWYDTVTCQMQRFRREGQLNAVARVCAVTSADHLLVAGHQSGDVSAFVVPRLARGDVPEYVRISEMNIKKALQFGVAAEHTAPVTALCCSQNAQKIFSGDKTGVVTLSEIDYATESVSSRVILREPSPIVQLRYSKQTLLVATRARCLLWNLTDGTVSQVGTKARKMPADLGACYLDDGAGRLSVLAARAALKVVTADLTGTVGATISLKPTLEAARSVELLYPVRPRPVDSAPGSGPGRLVTLGPDKVALHDAHSLLVVDTSRWEIVYRCDRLPAILDVAAAGDAIYVLCSPRRLIRLSVNPDTHPSVCEGLRVASGELSLEEVLEDLRSAAPVAHMKTMLNTVSGQLEKSGLLDKLSSTSGAVSSLTARVGSLMGFGGPPPSTRFPVPPLRPVARAPLGSSSSSPDVRRPDAEAEEAQTAPVSPAPSLRDIVVVHPNPDDAPSPIAKQMRPRRRPGRRSRKLAGVGDARSLDTVSLSGDLAVGGGEGIGEPERTVVHQGMSDEGMSVVNAECLTAESGGGNVPEIVSNVWDKTSSIADINVRLEGRHLALETKESDNVSTELSSRLNPLDGAVSVPSLPTELPEGRLDFTQFYPSDMRPQLEKTNSQLSDETQEKEQQLARLLGLDDLAVKPPPLSAEQSCSSVPSPSSQEGLSPPQNLSPPDEAFLWRPQIVASSRADRKSADVDGEESVSPPAPSFSSLFPFNKPDTHSSSEDVSADPPEGDIAVPILDGETGEPIRPAPAIVRHPDTADGAAPDADDVAAGWQPWQRQAAPCFVVSLSACCQYTVLTDPDEKVYWSPAHGDSKWELLDYAATQVAVSADGRRVWRLDSAGSAYALADPELGRPRGSHWVKAARDVQQLSVDESAVWYIKHGGRLFVQRDLAGLRCAAPEFPVEAPAPLIHVSARDGVVWVVTEQGAVYWRVGVSRAHSAGLGWEPLPVGPLLVRAAYLGAGGTGWLVDTRARLHFVTGVTADVPRGVDGVWRRVLGLRTLAGSPAGRQLAVPQAGASLRPSVAVEGGVAWFADASVMNIFSNRHRITGVRWEQYRPRGRELSWSEVHAGGLYQRKGQLWAVARGQLYGGEAHDGTLKPIALPTRSCQLQCVSTAPGALWLLCAAGRVYVREGVELDACGTDWVQLDLLQIDRCRLVHLSVGAQSVWACDARGRVLIRLGPTVARRSPTGLQPAWVTLDSPPGVKFVQVCVGPGDSPVWALDSCGLPWWREGITQQLLVGTEWVAAPGLTADQLTVAPCGAWARAARTGAVHRWLPTQAAWCRVPGSTSHVSASVSGELWAVHDSGLYTLHTLSIVPGRPVTPRVKRQSSLALTDDADWEHVTY